MGLNAATEWIDTDNIFETREYRAFAWNTNSAPVYTNSELKSYVDQLVDVEGLNHPRQYITIHENLKVHFPDSQ